MIVAREEIERLRVGMQNQTEEVVHLKHVEMKVVEQSNQISILEAQLGEANASSQELREKVAMLETKCRHIVAQVLPHACLELVKSEELGVLITDYVNANQAEARSILMVELAAERKTILATHMGYMPHASQAVEVASEAIVTTKFPFVQELIANPDASVAELLSVKPHCLPKPWWL